METLIRFASQVRTALVGGTAAMVAMAATVTSELSPPWWARCVRAEPSGVPVERVLLVGFSAGAPSSLQAADTPGVVGFVGLDPLDRTMSGEARRLGLAAAGRLRTEVMLLRALPSRCNAEAVAAHWGTALPALWRDERIAGASNCDFESPADWVCRLACGDADPARQQQVRQVLLDAAARWPR
jgi:hypothetical protein